MKYNPEKKAAFLGPQSENLKVFEDLILDAIRDYFYWRKNFHPEDKLIINEEDKLNENFIRTVSTLRQELTNILAELKKGVPFFSTRYLGHMNSDLFLASIVGYISAMLYNQNNVVAESSPVTIQKEIDYINAVAKMIGYKLVTTKNEIGSWGHISSGGTTANLEAMWAIRNIKFYPLALLLFHKMLQNSYNEQSEPFNEILSNLNISLPNNEEKGFINLNAFQLLSLSPNSVLNIRNQIKDLFNKNKILDAFYLLEDELPTINRLGFIKFKEKCSEHGIEFKQPVIVLPSSKHYCWPKIADLIGLGKETLIEIDVDNDFRLDIKKTSDKIEELINNERPILSIVSVCGTTEEGAIDPVSDIVNLRANYEKNRNISFWLHSDAAYGGFFASLKDDDEMNGKLKNIKALENFDSIVIDPHKLGYVPYPAGVVVYRDARIRDHITFEAPYLSDNEEIIKAFLGKWTLEGSRPGAAAISCYLAQHCFPYDSNGHGKLLKDCLKSTDKLSEIFEEINYFNFEIKKLYEPELNILCYAVTSKKYIRNPYLLNKLNLKIWENSTANETKPWNSYKFIVSKTEYPISQYTNQVRQFLEDKCGCDTSILRNDNNFRLLTLRTVLMNPLITENPQILEEFAKYLCETAFNVLPEIQLNFIREKLKRRMKVLVVEDLEGERNTIQRNFELEFDVSKAFELIIASNYNEAIEQYKKYNPDALVVDLNLSGVPNDFQGLELIYDLKEKVDKIVVFSAYLNNDPILISALEGLGINENLMVRRGSSNLTEKREEFRNVLNALIYTLQ